jgi:hypothetical protein
VPRAHHVQFHHLPLETDRPGDERAGSDTYPCPGQLLRRAIPSASLLPSEADFMTEGDFFHAAFVGVAPPGEVAPERSRFFGGDEKLEIVVVLAIVIPTNPVLVVIVSESTWPIIVIMVLLYSAVVASMTRAILYLLKIVTIRSHGGF